MGADHQQDTVYMAEALRLAAQARGRTSPNPMVGAIVVKDGRIIGQGYHAKAGMPHAEIEAFRSAQESLQGATLYVTLEPCCHYGKTPPCTEAIIRAGIRRVVAAMVDPNPRVSGKGIQQLRDAGMGVDVGLLEAQARQLNEAFIKHQTTGLPLVIAKFAMSLDGKIATKTGESKYLTNEASRAYVHALRDQVDAIMVGVGTVRADDPLLTTRRVDGGGQNPRRIIIDTHLSTPLTAKVVTTIAEASTTIFTGQAVDPQKIRQFREKGVDIQLVGYEEEQETPSLLPPFGKLRTSPRRGMRPEQPGKLNLPKVFEVLGRQQILAVLLEGGAELNGSAFRHRLVDKVLVFLAPLIIGGKDARSPVEGEGIANLSDAIRLEQMTTQCFGDDVMIEGYVKDISKSSLKAL